MEKSTNRPGPATHAMPGFPARLPWFVVLTAALTAALVALMLQPLDARQFGSVAAGALLMFALWILSAARVRSVVPWPAKERQHLSIAHVLFGLGIIGVALLGITNMPGVVCAALAVGGLADQAYLVVRLNRAVISQPMRTH